MGAGQPVRDAIFPARRQAGGISTAAAVHNLGAESMVVSCRLMKSGAVLEEVAIPLEANGQEALYIDLVAWIIPKDALSSCFSTPGIT